jgi:hypothetical protein
MKGSPRWSQKYTLCFPTISDIALRRQAPAGPQLAFFLVLDTTRKFTGSFSDGAPT